MFDIIWVTWACSVSVLVVGDIGWWFYAVVPVFAVWKGWGLFGAARGMMGGGQGQQMPQEQVPQMNRKQRRAAA